MIQTDLNIFGENIATKEPIGLNVEDRRRHTYVIGKSGGGKTSLLTTMILNDLKAGFGVAFLDPYGEMSEKVEAILPENRKQDLVHVTFNSQDEFETFLNEQILHAENLQKILNGKILSIQFLRSKIDSETISKLGTRFLEAFLTAAVELRKKESEDKRQDFFLYVDEFPGFGENREWLEILPQLRAFRLNLTLSHQYLEQLNENTQNLILGNVGNTISFAIGNFDSSIMALHLLGQNASQVDLDSLKAKLINLPPLYFVASLLKNNVSTPLVSGKVLAS